MGDSEYCTFIFDHIFYSASTQEEIFECVGKPIVEDVLAGYNGTVLAYGQTGSGKTHSMMGQLGNPEQEGLIPRSASLIFQAIMSDEVGTVFTIKISMLEIYKEALKDLLYVSDVKLKIKETAEGITVDGLTEEYVGGEQELMDRIEYGQENRTVACTKMNSRSSRSHQLFIIKVHQRFADGLEKTGTLNLVDLAGSEKISASGVKGLGLEEAKKINLSLSMLGHVIHQLSQGASHIPYRDSKLTRLLQESLGGNFKTRLLVAGSPHIRNLEETISTLKFAQRAKTVKTKAKMNLKEAPDIVIARLTKQLEEAFAYIEELKRIIERSLGSGVPLSMPQVQPYSQPFAQAEGQCDPEDQSFSQAEGQSYIQTEGQQPYIQTEDQPYNPTEDQPYLQTEDQAYIQTEGGPYLQTEGSIHTPKTEALQLDSRSVTPQAEGSVVPVKKMRRFSQAEDRTVSQPEVRISLQTEEEGVPESRSYPPSEAPPSPQPEGRPLPQSEGRPTSKPENRVYGKPKGREPAKPAGRSLPRSPAKQEDRSTLRPEAQPAGSDAPAALPENPPDTSLVEDLPAGQLDVSTLRPEGPATTTSSPGGRTAPASRPTGPAAVPASRSTKPPGSSTAKPPGSSAATLPDGSSARLPEESPATLPEDSFARSESCPVKLTDGSTELPKGSSAKLPHGSSTKRPHGSSAKLPDGSSVKLPEESSATLLEGSPVKLPEGSSAKRHEARAARTSEGSTIKLPEELPVPALPEGSTELPKGKSAKHTHGSSTKRPHGSSAKRHEARAARTSEGSTIKLPEELPVPALPEGPTPAPSKHHAAALSQEALFTTPDGQVSTPATANSFTQPALRSLAPSSKGLHDRWRSSDTFALDSDALTGSPIQMQRSALYLPDMVDSLQEIPHDFSQHSMVIRDQLDVIPDINEEDSGKFAGVADIQRNWEMLRMQYELQLRALRKQNEDLQGDKLRLKHKNSSLRSQNQSLEQFFMTHLDACKHRKLQQTPYSDLSRKDNEVAILKREVRGLTQRLLEAEGRAREAVEQKRPDWVEMEEVVSCDSSFVRST